MSDHDVVQKLRELAALHAVGSLSDAEFARAKAALLSVPPQETSVAARRATVRMAPYPAPPPFSAQRPPARRARAGLVMTVVAGVALLTTTVVFAVSALLGIDPATSGIEDDPLVIGGMLDVWLVGSPDEPAPPAVLPTEFTALLAAHEIIPRLSVHSAAAFPDAYARVASGPEAPEILAGRSYLPFREGMASAGWSVVSARGPIESVVDDSGFVFLPVSADRHGDAVRLAIDGTRCTPASAAPQSTLDPDAVDTALSAVRTSIEAPAEMARFLAPASLLSVTDDQTRAIRVHGLRACTAAGNSSSGVVQVAIAASSSGLAGQFERTVVIVPGGSGWAVPSITDGAPPPELMAAADRAGRTPGTGGEVKLALVAPADGLEPRPDAQNHQNFDWSTTGDSPAVLAEFLELAPGEVQLLVPAERTGLSLRAHIGNSAFNAVVRWRAWAVLDDGTIAISAVRSYPSYY